MKKNSDESLRSTLGSSSSLNLSKASTGSTLVNHGNTNDSEVLDKSCSLNRVSISSNYWKIPNKKMDLTSIAVDTRANNQSTLAISSSGLESNLYIYELDAANNFLMHHNTISLPNIYSMEWLSYEENNNKYLLTGNDKGYASLVSIPKPEEQGKPAEVVKRFNHRKHLSRQQKNKNYIPNNTGVSKIKLMSNNDMISIYDSHLFLWDIGGCDTQMKPITKQIVNVPRIMNFEPVLSDQNTIGVCGDFGVSLFDVREPKFCVPSTMLGKVHKKKMASNIMLWCPSSEYIFASGHLDGVVRIWDVRKQEAMGELKGHSGSWILSLEWNEFNLLSGGKDGNIIHWDLDSELRSEEPNIKNCTLREGLDSVNFNPSRNTIEETLSQRQCGIVLPASNTGITAMTSIRDRLQSPHFMQVLSIDSSSFLGLHSKIHNAVDMNNTGKSFYTEDDISLMRADQNAKEATPASLLSPAISHTSVKEAATPSQASARKLHSHSNSVLTNEFNSSDETLTSPHEHHHDLLLLSTKENDFSAMSTYYDADTLSLSDPSALDNSFDDSISTYSTVVDPVDFCENQHQRTSSKSSNFLADMLSCLNLNSISLYFHEHSI